MRPALASTVLVLAANTAAADVPVRCDRGQSLAQVLAMLPRQFPLTLSVTGTCTEYVSIEGFDGLTLRSTTGAVLRQPPVVPAVLTGVLTITASRSVTIDGLTVETTLNDGTAGIFVHDGTTHLRLRRTTVTGTGPGIYVADLSEASLDQVTVRTGGWGAIGVWHSKIEVAHSLLQNPHEDYQEGIQVAQNAVLLIHATTIRHMWNGINVLDGGMVNVQEVTDESPSVSPADVVIDDPPGIHLWGLRLVNGGRVNLSAPLHILKPGAQWGGETGGVLVDAASSLGGGQFLEVRDSIAQGVLVKNNSHASLGGAQITGTLHSGVAAVNHATVDLGDASSGVATSISNSGAFDLYCDTTSLITGASNAPTASNTQCGNLIGGPNVPLP